MKNSELLKYIFDKLEKYHTKLYHSVSKIEVQKYIKTIKDIDSLDNIQFDYEMLKLFSFYKYEVLKTIFYM